MAAIIAGTSLGSASLSQPAFADSREEITEDSRQALNLLYSHNPAAAAISKKAKAVLIFPKILKAGLVFGAAYGEGELIKGDKVSNYYNSFTGSWGLQAGAQSYGYVVFLMNDKALNYLEESNGWEIGVGPTVVIVDEGFAKNISTSTLNDDAYAFIFDQEGLMAGISFEGTKISKIKQ
jgi:lipid-binding SYLF domain-containing protein